MQVVRGMGVFATALIALFLGYGPLWANASGLSLNPNVKALTLSNGMIFLVVHQPQVPIFTGYIRVKVGAVEEEPGKSGLAHLLEHMAFKGTARIGTRDYEQEKKSLDAINAVGRQLAAASESGADERKINSLRKQLLALEKQAARLRVSQEFTAIYNRNGGNGLNATTSQDMTSYFVQLPSNRLELWAWLESERFLDPVMREFYLEKQVVIQERRERVDNDPMGQFYERFITEAFGAHPYGGDTIGTVADLNRLTDIDLSAFFKKYYTPDRMVGTLVGDLPPLTSLKSLLEETFGRLPKTTAPEPEWPRFKRAHETVFAMTGTAEPALMMGWPKPTLPARDDTVFDVFQALFCGDESSRLMTELVFKQQLASEVECYSGIPGVRLENLFLISAKPLPGIELERLQAAIDAEIERVKREPFADEELEKARHQLMSQQLWSMRTTDGLAGTLSYFQLVAGDWRYLSRSLETIQSVSRRDLKRLAEKYLHADVRVLGFMRSESP